MFTLMPIDCIRFTQSLVSDTFSNSIQLSDTVRKLKRGNITPESLPTIRVVYHDDKVWSLDNRRLLCYKLADYDMNIKVKIVEKDKEFLNKKDNKYGYQVSINRRARIPLQMKNGSIIGEINDCSSCESITEDICNFSKCVDCCDGCSFHEYRSYYKKSCILCNNIAAKRCSQKKCGNCCYGCLVHRYRFCDCGELIDQECTFDKCEDCCKGCGFHEFTYCDCGKRFVDIFCTENKCQKCCYGCKFH